MQKYVVQRLLLTIPTLIVITIVAFVGLRALLPTSVVDRILGEFATSDPGLRKNLEDELGLSASIPRQYADWVGLSWFWGGPTGILEGNLGESLHSGRSVVSELKRRIPVSFTSRSKALAWSAMIIELAPCTCTG